MGRKSGRIHKNHREKAKKNNIIAIYVTVSVPDIGVRIPIRSIIGEIYRDERDES